MKKKLIIGVLVSMLMFGGQAFACGQGGGGQGGGGGSGGGGSGSGGGSSSDASGSGSGSSSVEAQSEAQGSGGGPYITEIPNLVAPVRNQKCYGFFGSRFEMCVE